MHDARIELLAPAKDGTIARAAIRCGADAVYLGAERFGAREATCNSIETIGDIVDFAHAYYARVYVALNTLLHDNELAAAEKMIGRLYDTGVDGLIIQDVGLLELDLSPIPLIASTQMHNATVERVKFWQDVGFSRAILARELTLEQIREIRRQTRIDLECFVHGALCVGASGQCYLSYALGGRSGNRGQCAQPCRRPYSLHGARGETIVPPRHLLSLKDLNLSDYLANLIDAGVTSFKIEGRLRDLAYVVNTVSYYRRKLDVILTEKGLRRASSGTVRLDFEPDPSRTFNRGFTDYGLAGCIASIGSIDTPKSIGQFIGTVTRVEESCFVLDRDADLHGGDGICFFDSRRDLTGTVVNGVDGRTIRPQKMQDIRVGQQMYRNYDHQFWRKLARVPANRKIGVTVQLSGTEQGLILGGADEDGNRATVRIDGPWQRASDENAARRMIAEHLSRLGDTPFECSDVRIHTEAVYFIPVSRINGARRELISLLRTAREANRPRPRRAAEKADAVFPQAHLSYTGNVLNAKAREFYRRHGVQTIEPAAESGLGMAGRVLMTTKYCLRRELGWCDGVRSQRSAEPLILRDEEGRRFQVRFRCGPCGMDVLAPESNGPTPAAAEPEEP